MSYNAELKVGFQDDTATVANISESSTVAVVEVGQRELKKIEAPNEGYLSVHLAMISYLNSSVVKKLTDGTRKNIALAIDYFFSFLSTFKDDDKVPLDCINLYSQYQRSHTNSDTSIYNILNRVKNALKWCFSKSSPLNDEIKSLCRLYHLHAPDIQKPESEPTQTLSSLFSECPYNDTQLLDSLIKLCIWIIHHEAHLRSKALQLDGIRHLIDNLKFKNINEKPISFGSLAAGEATQDEARTLYGTILTNVRNSNNLVLKERSVADIRHPFEEDALTEEQLNWVLDKSLMLHKEGKPPKCRQSYFITKGGKSTAYSVGAIRCLSIRSLLVPTDIECFAMQCMLACEKMNISSIEKLTLDDFVKTPKGVQFHLQKGRRNQNKQANITTLHGLATTIGKSYLLFVQAMTSGQDYFNTPGHGKLLNYQVKRTHSGYLGAIGFGDASNTYVDLLHTENSHLRNQLLKDFKDSTRELEPVFWLLSKVCEQNKKNEAQSIEHQIVNKQNKSIKRSEFVTERSVGVSVAAIRQTTIISEAMTSRSIDPKVDAQLANHSLAVHNIVYINRSTAKEKIESDRLFVSRIGALMEQDANLIGNLVEETSVLDYNQALEMLGLPRGDEGVHERISKKIVELGIDTDLMDSFQANGKKIFLVRISEHSEQPFRDDPNTYFGLIRTLIPR